MGYFPSLGSSAQGSPAGRRVRICIQELEVRSSRGSWAIGAVVSAGGQLFQPAPGAFLSRSDSVGRVAEAAAAFQGMDGRARLCLLFAHHSVWDVGPESGSVWLLLRRRTPAWLQLTAGSRGQRLSRLAADRAMPGPYIGDKSSLSSFSFLGGG